jgi:hypothetical protein
VLLFGASQRMMLCSGEEAAHDLTYAASYLNLLSLCSYNSATARTLYATLQVIFNDAREIIVSSDFRHMRDRYADVHAAAGHAGDERPGIEESSASADIRGRIRDLVFQIMNVLEKRLSF